MRSQLLVLSIISLAVAGCGKSVERTANPVAQSQQAGLPAQGLTPPTDTRPGNCHDPIETTYKKIATFSEVAHTFGNYELTKIEAVGLATRGAGSPSAVSGISVVTATPKAGGDFDYSECRDLSAMPLEGFQWGIVTPGAIEAKDGSIAKDLHLTQSVYGPNVMDQSGPRAPVRNLNEKKTENCFYADDLIAGAACTPAEIYQIDANTIGILRTAEASTNGMIVTSKVFAQYSIKATTPDPTDPTDPTEPTDPRDPPTTKNPKKGKSGKQGKHDPVKPEPKKKPVPSGNSGNQGQSGTQGKRGKQGSGTTTVTTSSSSSTATNSNPPCCDVTPAPTTPAPTTTTNTPPTVVVLDEDVRRFKHKEKEVTVTKSESGEETRTKDKLTVKAKSIPERGLHKVKIESKSKETTTAADGTVVEKSKSKAKSKTKIKLN